MPTLEFSSGYMTGGFASNFLNNYINTPEGGLGPASYAVLSTTSQSNSYRTYIRILKGALPASFSSIGIGNDGYWPGEFNRVADVLITWSQLSTGNLTITLSGTSAVVNGSFGPASASGVASWFLIESGNVNGQMNQYMMGTVGETGSGADLTITSTNIISGVSYRVIDFTFAVPSSWTY